MKHKQSFNRLDRKASHRRALHNNMVTALLRHGRIRTTKAKALEIRRTAERMITRARVDSVHNRRMIARRIQDGAVLAKLFGTIAERFQTRPGGYTRVLKLGPRYGDASEMVILELLQDGEEASRPAPARKGVSAKKSETSVAEGDAARETDVAVAVAGTTDDDAGSSAEPADGQPGEGEASTGESSNGGADEQESD